MIGSRMEPGLGRLEYDTPSPIPYLPTDIPPSSSRLLLQTSHTHSYYQQATPAHPQSRSLLEFAGDQSSLYSTTTSRATTFRGRPHPPAPPTTNNMLQRQLVPRADLNTLVPMSESLVSGHTRLAADTGLFLGRSFRVGWGPNWTLAHSGSLIDSRSGSKSGNQTSTIGVIVERVYPTPFMINAPPRKISVSHSKNFLLILKIKLIFCFFSHFLSRI